MLIAFVNLGFILTCNVLHMFASFNICNSLLLIFKAKALLFFRAHYRAHARQSPLQLLVLLLLDWAIPLFNYTPLQMTINGVQGNMSQGWSFKCLSRGLEGIIEACLGGREQHRSLSRGVEQNRSLSRGHLQVCPGEVEI